MAIDSIETMKVEDVELARLVADPVNARVHNDRNRAAVRASIQSFGVIQPLVVQRKGARVIGGNLRAEVLREMGFQTAPVVWMDLDDDEADALALSLNRSADLAEWDYMRVAETMERIKEAGTSDLILESTGWSQHELAAIGANIESIPYEEAIDDDEDVGDQLHSFSIKVQTDTKDQERQVKAAVRRALEDLDGVRLT